MTWPISIICSTRMGKKKKTSWLLSGGLETVCDRKNTRKKKLKEKTWLMIYLLSQQRFRKLSRREVEGIFSEDKAAYGTHLGKLL